MGIRARGASYHERHRKNLPHPPTAPTLPRPQAIRAHPAIGRVEAIDPMEYIQQLLDIFFHLDRHLNEWMIVLGPWLYLILFAIVFAETGLVVTPFLPGDSLLFATGALAAMGTTLNVWVVILLLITAAILGDAVNYSVGRYLGPKVFHSETSRLLNRKHLLQAQSFYEKYGGKTIVLARFIPIIRTFAPFVAGIGKMGYPRFALFNITGGIAWVCSFTLAGYFFGNLPSIKRNFHYVIVAIVLISVMPAVIEYWRARRQTQRDQSATSPPPASPEG
jgi:membrane-associated protein